MDFDHAAAQAAAAQCQAVANRLVSARSRRGQLARLAAERWEGRYGEEFDREDAAVDTRTERLVVALRNLAGATGDAARAARAEQDRREAERARWHREKAAADQRRAEEAAAAQAAAQPTGGS
ncbi:MAG TPA: hypothetical protein VM324_16010 [Egibacteraceae bacterium]|nr:hypothetical protein [Egibacteraceae bacterium]